MISHLLLQEISKVVKGEVGQQDLETWLLSHLQATLLSGDKEAISLANELDAMFIDLGEELISSEEFDYQLETMLRREESTKRVEVGSPSVRIVSQRTIHKRAEIPGRVTTLYPAVTHSA